MKTIRFFAAYMGRFYGVLLALVAADIALSRLFGPDSFFGSYLYIFPWLFCWLGNIALMQLSNAYAQLALGFGATRRQIMAATAVCWLGSALVGSLLGWGSGLAVRLVIPQPPDNEFLLLFAAVPAWKWLLQGLLGGAVGAWCAHLPHGGWWVALHIVLQLMLVCAPYMLLALLPLISAQPGWGWTAWLPSANGLLSPPFLILALRAQRRLAVTT